jgi:hypothetical protein
MIHEYVKKLIINLPEDMKQQKEPIILDLVLDGGAFNGSYLVGALCFLKEMEKNNYVKIKRISSCSISSVIGLLYFIDALDKMPYLYTVTKTHFSKEHNLNIVKQLKTLLKDNIPDDICDRIKGRLFICYHNIKTGKKIVKTHFKNVDDIFHSIFRSCYIPYLTDGNICYRDKYIDGCIPHVFEKEKDKGRKILYLDLLGYDKIGNILSITNEKNNFHRILSGLLDIHMFFIKQSNTSMCSYVNDWSIVNKTWFLSKIVFEKMTIFFIQALLYVKKMLPEETHDTFLYKLAANIMKEMMGTIIDYYCI